MEGPRGSGRKPCVSLRRWEADDIWGVIDRCHMILLQQVALENSHLCTKKPPSSHKKVRFQFLLR